MNEFHLIIWGVLLIGMIIFMFSIRNININTQNRFNIWINHNWILGFFGSLVIIYTIAYFVFDGNIIFGLPFVLVCNNYFDRIRSVFRQEERTRAVQELEQAMANRARTVSQLAETRAEKKKIIKNIEETSKFKKQQETKEGDFIL